jgi:hypothetical protein
MSDKAIIPRVFHEDLAAWLSTKEDGPLFENLNIVPFGYGLNDWVKC